VLVAAVRLRLPGQAADAAGAPSAVSRAVLPDYFDTMEIPIVSGRALGREDRRESRRVAVISRTMARRYFPDVDPVGRSFSIDGAGGQPIEIVGVAGDVMTAGVDPAPQPVFYLPHAQNPLAVMTVVMRVTRGDPAAVAREAERIAWSISPSTNVYAVETMTQYLADLNWRARFAAVALGGFAILGIVLAAAGLYAVVAYTVLQRRGEIGLRMALGAGARAVVAMILGDALGPVIAGIVAGNVASAVLTRSMRGLLYGVAPGDPATLAAVSVALVLLAAGACLVPAIAASRVDPQIALKEQT
jgi:ABC-type antimicrobial peptide transport system permease subunit